MSARSFLAILTAFAYIVLDRGVAQAMDRVGALSRRTLIDDRRVSSGEHVRISQLTQGMHLLYEETEKHPGTINFTR